MKHYAPNRWPLKKIHPIMYVRQEYNSTKLKS